MLEQYLQRLGLDDKEQKIYTVLAELGVQPASVIAKRCKFDRVTTYKHLQKLADRGFVKIYVEQSVQRFGVESFDNLQTHIKEKMQDTQRLLDDFPLALGLLKSLQDTQQVVPRLQIFEGEHGIRSCFRDVLSEIKTQGIKQVRMLTSNTYDERLGQKTLADFAAQFCDDIRAHTIDVEVFEATGTLLAEQLEKVPFESLDPAKLPAARGATSIFLVGKAAYLISFKESQIGLKIKHAEISQIFHFLFDMMGKMVKG